MCIIQQINHYSTLGQMLPDQWTRKVLSTNDNALLVLVDHTGGISFSQTTQSFNGNVAGVQILTNTEEYTASSPAEIHAVAHTEGYERERLAASFFSVAPPKKKVIILHVSTQNCVPHKSEANADFVWLSMMDRSAYEKTEKWLGEFLQLSFDQATTLAGFTSRADTKEFEKGYSHFLDIILPEYTEAFLAFQILCEAKQKCGDAQTGEFNGLTIHAPMNIKDWKRPFGNDKTIDKVAKMIGTGDVEAKAVAVLNAANGNGDLSNAISVFLDVPVPGKKKE